MFPVSNTLPLSDRLLDLSQKKSRFASCYEACLKGDFEQVKLLLNNDSSLLSQCDDEGQTLLYACAASNELEILKWLSEQNSLALKQVRTDGKTLMHIAAIEGHFELVKWLNGKNSSFIDQVDKNQFTPLHEAAFHEHIPICKLFVEKLKAAVLLIRQIAQRKCPKTLAFLLESGLKPDTLNASNQTLLHLAAAAGQEQNILCLLQHGAFINAKDQDGKTPLHKAVWGDPKPETVKLLLARGAGVNAENRYGYTPLHWAAEHGHAESAEILLKAGAKLNSINANQALPFDLAICHEQEDFIRHFLGASKKSVNESIPKDIEGYYYKKLLKAKEAKQIEEQILCLQVLSYHYVEKKDVITASKILNAALALINKLPEKPCLKVTEQSIIHRLELIEKTFLESKGISQKLKRSFTEYRALLKDIRKVNKDADIKTTLHWLTTQFRSLLGMMIAEIQEIMGKPPVKWACMGMGSMSRDEMCPYSDVEFSFVLEMETEKAMDYFRTLSQILELRIINLGETKFPIFGDRYPSPTPDGFCMDSGGNTPLGVKDVYELIGTPKSLAKFQGVQWMDRSIILPNAMSHVCVVAGKEGLVDDYNKEKAKAQELTDKKSKDKNSLILSIRLLKGHVEEFAPNLTKEKEVVSAFGIKKELYRPFQEIISSLSLFYQLNSKTTFTRIDELVTLGIFSKKGGENLKKAITQVLKLRLNAHLFYQNEEEYLCHPEEGKPLDPCLMYFNEDTLKILKEIYRILIPFHRSAEKFLKTKNNEEFKNSDFYDEHSKDQGLQFDKDLQYAKAQEAHQQAVALNPNDVDALWDLGLIEDKMGSSQNALLRSLKALEIARAKHGKNHPDVATSYNNIGGIYESLGDYEKALKCFQKALEIWQQVPGDNPSIAAISFDSIGMIYNNIGMIYNHLGNYEKALEHLQQALKIRRQTLGDNHPDLAIGYNNLGAVCEILGDYQKALKYHQQTLKFRLQALVNNHPDVADSYHNIGTVYINLGDYEKALEFLQKALKIRQQVLGDNHPDVARNFNNIGTVYINLGDYEKALEFLQKALKIRRQALGVNHPDVAESYNNIGLVYYCLSNYEKALEFYLQASKICQQALGENHPDVAISYNNIGKVYDHLGDYEKALEFLQKTLQIQLQVFGDNHPHVAKSYDNIGTAYDSLEDYEQALEFYLKTLKIRLHVFGDNHPFVAKSYNNIGAAYDSLGDYEKALEFLQKALKIRLQVLEDNHPDVADSYHNIGLAYGRLGDYEQALEFYLKTLKIWLQVLAYNHPSVADCYHNTGLAYYKLGNHEKALEFLSKYKSCS